MNSVEVEKKAILFTSIGAPKYAVALPLEEKSYAELVKLFEDHFNPKLSEIVKQFKFNTHFRKPGELVTVFIT